MPDGKRAFMMGNALVVGLVERIADELIKRGRAPSRPRTGRRLLTRDGRAPTTEPAAVQPAVRNVMRANRARDTGPERQLRRALREAGLAGTGSTGRRRRAGPTSRTPAASSRSSSTAATGTTARAVTRTCRSPTRSSGLASSSST